MTKDADSRPLLETQPPEQSWEKLDRLDWHLWLLAILLIFVLGVGLITFMFPTAIWLGEALPMKAPDRAFYGFCVLLALVLVYLLQKSAKMRQLKQELFAAQAALARAEREAAIQSFQSLPSMNQFRDMLAMEYRRASTSGAPMAVVLFNVSRASSERLGRMSCLLRSMTREGETLYRISDKAVGIILPGMKLSNGASFAARVEALSGIPKQELEVSITAFPEDASSLTELEGKLRGRNKLIWSPGEIPCPQEPQGLHQPARRDTG